MARSHLVEGFEAAVDLALVCFPDEAGVMEHDQSEP